MSTPIPLIEVTTVKLDDRIKNLRLKITDTASAILEHGKEIVSILDEGHCRIEELADKLRLPVNVVADFERVGRKQLLPSLIYGAFEAVGSVKQLPYSKQIELVENKGTIEVATYKVDGTFDTRQMTVDQLSGKEIKQVFTRSSTGTGIRNLAQQRSHLESEKQKATLHANKKAAPKDDGWTIKGKSMFHKGTEFTAATLLAILAQINAK